jgi:4-hydroxy-3-methylbut-2-en-1-yl diphosphate synthase IspG/GcpE
MNADTIRAQPEDYASAASDAAEVADHHGLRGLAARLRSCSWVPLSSSEVESLVAEVGSRVGGDDGTLLISLLGCIIAGRTEAAIAAAGVWRRGGRVAAPALADLRVRVEREQEMEGRALGMLADPTDAGRGGRASSPPDPP